MAPISLSDEYDTRKVQTAVLGGAGSDWPVFLPYDHTDFDRFMRGRGRDDFYCGTLLGGCGKKLTAKRYLHKKCHFAHRPPVHCRRTQNGENSADHLYIGQALQRWLRQQGHQKVSVSYPDLGSGPGGAVEVRFGPGRPRLIRVQMDRMSLKQWETTRTQFAERSLRVQWAYGPNSGIAHKEAAATGHAIRFSCRTEGDTRQVYVGTQRPDHSVELATLDKCRLTEEGIITPHLTDEPSVTADTDAGTDTAALPAFPLVPGGLAFTAAVPVEEQNVTARRVYEADVQPLGSVMTRMRIALPLHAVPPSPHRLNVIESTAHLVPLTGSGVGEPNWLIEAVGFSPLAAQTDPRWPDLRPAPEPPATPERSAARAEATPMNGKEVLLAASLRTKLTEVARSRGLINWETLLRHKGYASEDFTPESRVRVLVAVDQPRSSNKPVLSSLVKMAGESGKAPSHFGQVLVGLGWKADLSSAEVEKIWAQQRQAAYSSIPKKTPPSSSQNAILAIKENRFIWQKMGVKRKNVVKAVREALISAAQRRVSIGWHTLAAAAGLRPEALPDATRASILIDVDRTSSPDGILLSSLVTSSENRPVPYFAEILKHLGRPHSSLPIELGRIRKVEQARVFAAYAHSSVHKGP